MSPFRIFSGTSTELLSKKIAAANGTSLGAIDVDRFSDGEICPRYRESVRGRSVYLVQSTYGSAENLMELLLMIDAAKRASAESINLAIPYFGYARQDRKDRPRVPIASKLVVNLLQAAGASRVITLDLHADQIQGFFDIPVDHLNASVIFCPYLKTLNLENLMFASPDVGGTKRTIHFAKIFGAPMVIIDKHRKRANEVDSMQIIGDVTDQNVILIDDLVDTGGTLARAAELVLEKGARSVRAVCTHPVLSGKGHENIETSVLEELIVTDTIPLKQESKKIKVLTAANLFAESFALIHENKSVSALFEN